ncbi:DUF6651 domain-containing protein [Ancylobacter sp. VNQ12]|uniref:DUF6651 domain-containing protein n=1 Tax=Ancylobacter sp. VNQ12 TaxID=3400920 RepID=UPI003C0A7BB1
MQLKTVTVDGKTYAEVSDGKPLYVQDGKEVAFDAAATVSTINRITEESKGYKTRAQTAEDKLKAFDGIADPKAAKDALAKVANYGDKELVEAGKVEEIKAAAIKAVEDRYAPIVQENEALKGALHGEKIGGAFARSKFIADKIAVPADIIESRFGKNFKLEDGQVVAYDHSGNKLYSKAKPGNPAEFDEALELLVDAYPYKDSILKGTGNSGTGKQPNAAGGNGTKTMPRSEFDKLPAGDQMAKMRDGFTLTDA